MDCSRVKCQMRHFIRSLDGEGEWMREVVGKGQQAAWRMQPKTDALVRTRVHYITQSSCANQTHMPAIIRWHARKSRGPNERRQVRLTAGTLETTTRAEVAARRAIIFVAVV